MVQVLFDPTTTRLPSTQSGEGAFYEGRLYQRGRGLGFAGRRSGHGMGDIIRGVWKYIKPLALGAAKSVGKESLDAGSRILSNLAQGANLQETVKEEGKEGIRKVLEKASQKMQKGRGLGVKRLGRKRAKLLHPKVIMKPEDLLVGKSVPRSTAIKHRARSDNLGLY